MGTPQIVYFAAVAIYVAFRVIGFYMGYFQQINDVMDMK